MTKLSDTQRSILSQASQRADRLAIPPERLPAAARQTVAKSLLKQGFVSDEHASAYNARDAWQIDGQTGLLRITDAGLRAIDVELEMATAVDEVELGGMSVAEHDAAQALAQAALDAGVGLGADAAGGEEPMTASVCGARPDVALFPMAGQGDSLAAFPPPPPSSSDEAAQAPQRPPVPRHGANGRAAALRMAAASLAATWDGPEREGMDAAIAALREALAAPPARSARPARDTGAPRPPRTGTKRATVLALLCRDEGASIAQVIDTTGWQQHTVRGFLAGLKREGIAVYVLERVREVGPNKQGAKGSYSIYRIATATTPAEAG
ncbi:DUF3489 domain-containing protein [Neoroseomonas soli]|uniref:DUF3489 domain-containing protein n=1 Tax=Neoroseomonas soli TaxID=1081025 RepID=A0A9X9WTT6_9PROT|nr:DUF3489 domain-containing protein [Neoroseomonas soli]MBR0670565.1 DUF3489 domain-containing protein [Neoroseomonas soli]